MFSLLNVNSCKSFRRLLLPPFIPVSPLGAHSYKKMGVAPLPRPLRSLEAIKDPSTLNINLQLLILDFQLSFQGASND
jgi:hypothetical protein